MDDGVGLVLSELEEEDGLEAHEKVAVGERYKIGAETGYSLQHFILAISLTCCY